MTLDDPPMRFGTNLVVDDRYPIIPEGVTFSVANRKVYIILGVVVAVLACIVIALAVVVGHNQSQKKIIIHDHANDTNNPIGNNTQPWKQRNDTHQGGGNNHQGGSGNNNKTNHNQSKYADACFTADCLQTAVHIMNSMNKDVNPCKDFYKYSCGGWEKSHTIPASRTTYSVAYKTYMDNERKLVDLMTTPSKSNATNSAERKLKDFFRSCLHDYGRTKEAGKLIIDIIQNDFKGWYVLDPEAWKAGWDFPKVMAHLQTEYFVAAMIGVGVQLDPEDSEKSIIYIREGGLEPSYTLYTESSFFAYIKRKQAAYKDSIRTIGNLLIRDAGITLTPTEQAARVEQFANDAYEQEKAIYKARIQGLRFPSGWRGSRMTVDQLAANWTQIPWKGMLLDIFSAANVKDDTEVFVRYPQYLNIIDDVLRNESDSHIKDRMLNNYLVWRLVSTYANHLSSDYQYAKQKYLDVSLGIRKSTPTWEQCLITTKQRLGSLLASEYFLAHVGVDGKKQADKVFKAVKDSLTERVDDFTWMDPNTRSFAADKVKRIQDYIAHPDKYFNDTALDKLHAELTINASDGYLKNLFNANHFVKLLMNHELRTGYQFRMWGYMISRTGLGVQSYYYTSYNNLMVPAGALTYPLFRKTGPDFVNYGGLGAQMAGEMISAIDYYARYTRVNGTLFNWWSRDSFVNYRSKELCVSNYFDDKKAGPYLVNGVNKTVRVLVGRYYASEIYEQISGFKTSFKAYKELQKSTKDPSLPGLDLSIDQAFFVAAAQTKCIKRRDAQAYRYAASSWVPEYMRMNAAFAHMPDFAAAFKCKKGDDMVALDKCNMF